HVVGCIAVKSAAAGHDRALLDAVGRIEMLVVETEAERAPIAGAPIDLAEAGLLVGGARTGREKTAQSAVDRGALLRGGGRKTTGSNAPADPGSRCAI